MRLAREALLLCLTALAAAAPASDQGTLQTALERVHRNYVDVDVGETAQYIPALAEADPSAFGLAVVCIDGTVYSAGDADISFALMSAAKPFTLALLLDQRGPGFVREKIGVESTGDPFNAVPVGNAGPLNPMVNAGALSTVSHLEAADPKGRWSLISERYRAFAGEQLPLMQGVYESVSSGNYRNRALVNLLAERGALGADAATTLDIYNRQSSVAVTARQLAIMGATLANAGINPRTGERAVAASHVDEVLAVMMTAGLYDESGRWAYTVGVPAKSGVGGGIVAVVPGTMALAAYSPRLSPAGNSVRGTLALKALARDLDLSLFGPKGDPHSPALESSAALMAPCSH